jgi:hypothetical protein
MRNNIITIAIILLTGCSQGNYEDATTQTGQVQISLAVPVTSPARTLYPTLAGLTHYLDFTGPSGSSHARETITAGTQKALTLDTGNWTISASGESGGVVVSTGQTSVTIEADTIANATITLQPTTGGTGHLEYNIRLPSDTTGKLAVLDMTGTNASVSGNPWTLKAGSNTGTLNLPSGQYMLSVSSDNQAAFSGTLEIMHIYTGLTSSFLYPYPVPIQ